MVARAGTSVLAPYHDPGWEIWGLPWIVCSRLTRAFDVHAQSLVDADKHEFFRKDKWLKAFLERHPTTPIYCDPSRLHLPNSVEYPLDEIKKTIPLHSVFENSVCYMLAQAIHERVDEIGLYGIHMYIGPEADVALPGIGYLIGLAHGRGIRVTIPPGSPLLMSSFVDGRYGIGESRPRFLCHAGVKSYPTQQENV